MNRVRRVDDPDASPMSVEWVDRETLSNGDAVLVLPDEQVGISGRIERAAVPPAAVGGGIDIGDAGQSDNSIVQNDEGERRPAREGDRVTATDTIRGSIVVVRISRPGEVPWLSSARYGGALRAALVAGVLLFALAGTGFGAFNPVDDYTRGTGGFEDVTTAESTPTPAPPPSVTVTPPTTPTATPTRTTERETDSPTPTPEQETITLPTAGEEGSDGTGTEAPTDSPTLTPTATPTTTPTVATTTATAEPTTGETTEGIEPEPPGTGAVPAAGIDLSVDDVDEIRQRDGLVGRVATTVDGSVTVDGDAETTVVVVQSWVPGRGWAEVSRTTRAGGGTLSLSELLGEVVLASGDRAAAFDNPADGTTVESTGRVSVTAVMFDGAREVARVSTTDDYTLRVTNLAGGTGTLELGDENDTSSRALFGDDGLGSGDEAGSGGDGDAGADSGVVAPGSNGTNSIPLRNRGSEPGTLSLTDVSFVSYENGLTGPESAVDDTGGDPGRGAGELHAALELRMALERGDGSRTWVVGDHSTFRSVEALANETVELGTLAPGEEVDLVVEYRVPDSTGNEIQSDTVVVDVSFTLVGDG